MIGFSNILWILYFVIGISCYTYLRNAYFPQFPTKTESMVSGVLAFFWLISVPVTFVVKQTEGSETHHFQTSYDGFVGREA